MAVKYQNVFPDIKCYTYYQILFMIHNCAACFIKMKILLLWHEEYVYVLIKYSVWMILGLDYLSQDWIHEMKRKTVLFTSKCCNLTLTAMKVVLDVRFNKLNKNKIASFFISLIFGYLLMWFILGRN
jgi:hypothetical protein